MRKISFAGVELTSQRVRGLRGTSELPGRPVRALIFLARRIQPFLSLVDRGVDFLCTNDLIVLHSFGIFFLFLFQ